MMHVENFKISDIEEYLQIRSVKNYGVELLKEKIKSIGYLQDNPIIISKNDKNKLIAGNYRVEALKKLKIDTVPAIIYENLTEEEELRIARQSNEAEESYIPTTFVDDAELIWKKLETMTQQELANALGWGLSKIKQYSVLSNISKQAWRVIKKVTTFEKGSNNNDKSEVTEKVTAVTFFTEFLLRTIIKLKPFQQLELVKLLANNDISKNKFKALAKSYKNRNEMKQHLLKQIGGLGLSYIRKAFKETNTGRYDKEWEKDIKDGVEKLITYYKEEWQEKNSVTLINGDFYEEIKNIPDNSIDLIVTDPPYNLQGSNTFKYTDEEGNKIRTDKTFVFDDWDNVDKLSYLKSFRTWIKHFKRILREKGSCYVFTGDRYISHMREIIEEEGLKYKATLTFNKTNPGTSVVKTNYISATEYILYFIKGENGHTFNWDETEFENMLTHYTGQICGGNERCKDGKGNSMHPTQKPEKAINRLIEISSNPGDMVFDGFMGVGSIPAAAKKLKRKCIGIERNKIYYDVAVRRLQEIKS